MTKQTFTEWITTTSVNYIKQDHNQRAGQFFFNSAHTANPDLANLYRGTVFDPFYRDERLPDFLLKIGELW